MILQQKGSLIKCFVSVGYRYWIPYTRRVRGSARGAFWTDSRSRGVQKLSDSFRRKHAFRFLSGPVPRFRPSSHWKIAAWLNTTGACDSSRWVRRWLVGVAQSHTQRHMKNTSGVGKDWLLF